MNFDPVITDQLLEANELIKNRPLDLPKCLTAIEVFRICLD